MSARSAQLKGEVSALQSALTELTVTQTKAEVNAKHHFKMLKHSLEDQLKFDNKDKDDETSAKTASLEARAVVESDVVMTEKGLADSKASFESAEPNCTQLAQEHEATVAGRAEELKVIEEAKKVLMGTTSETNVTKADRGAEIDRSDVSSVSSTER